jgi:hypothetical protein
MKNYIILQRLIGFAIISGLCLISYSIYDYYYNRAVEGLVLYLFLIIVWLISFIISIIYLFLKSYRRISLISILINAISIILIFAFNLIIPETSLKKYNLPRKMTDKELKKSDFKKYSADSAYYLVMIYKEPDMAFGDGNSILGLYTHSNKIVDECVFGEFPIYFDSWKDNTIALKVKPDDKDSSAIRYISYWIERNKKIKNFNIHYDIK